MLFKLKFRNARWAWACGIVCLLLLAGCSQGTAQSNPVDESKAEDTLMHALDSWKEGETIESLQEQSTKIVVQDVDWTRGAKLLEYEVVGAPEPKDANLIVRVKLKLEDDSGTPSEKTVTYVVGTTPALTVFRDLLK
jgi:hypothetical protein